MLESASSSTPLPGVSTVSIDSRGMHGAEKIIYNLLCAWRLLRRRPPLLYIAGLNAGLLLWLYRLTGIKVVARLGSVDFLYPKFSFPERAVLLWCLFNFRLANRVVVVNQSYLSYVRTGTGKTRVIGNGADVHSQYVVDHDMLRHYGVKYKRFILSVGRITPEKGYRTLIEAFRIMGDCGYTLVIAGGGATDELPHEKLGGTVRLLGEVPHELMRHLYASCACYVNASIHEGQSNAALEAMSWEAPVLLSDIAGNRSLGLPDRHYFPPQDGPSLTRKLTELLQTPETFVVPTSFMMRFDWEKVCEELEGTFKEAIHG